MVYGSSTMLVYTTGCGVHAFTYDPSLGVFCLCQERMRFPEKGKPTPSTKETTLSFRNGVKKYIKFCQEEDKSTNRPYTSRYIGSLVADFHRNLLKGGIYLYPSTASHPDGKLRLLYECNPMAFLAEQAGGKASDGKERILDIIRKLCTSAVRSLSATTIWLKMSNALSVNSRTRNLLRLSTRRGVLSLRNIDSCHWRTLTILPQHR